MRNFKVTFLLTGIILSLIACSQYETSTHEADSPDRTCIVGSVQTGPDTGTLKIYTKSGFIDEVQTLEDVSMETIKEVTKDLGAC